MAELDDQGSLPDVIGAASAAALGMHGLDPMQAAAAAPMLSSLARNEFALLGRKREERAAVALDRARFEAGLSEEDLLRLLFASEAGQELLINALNAAQDAALDKKAEAIASALARGALAGSVEAVKLEDLFVRTLAAMDAAHFEVLEVFEQRANQGVTRPLQSADVLTDRTVLRERLPDLDVGVDAVPAVLQREGVIAITQRPGNPFQAEEAKWHLTDYGWSLLRSLRTVGQQLNAEGREADGG